MVRESAPVPRNRASAPASAFYLRMLAVTVFSVLPALPISDAPLYPVQPPTSLCALTGTVSREKILAKRRMAPGSALLSVCTPHRALEGQAGGFEVSAGALLLKHSIDPLPS